MSLIPHSKSPFIRSVWPALSCLLLLAGCGSVNLWPFGEVRTQERSRTPSDATAYQCDGGKRLYVRYLDGGRAAWVIFPEREFRLDKVASDSGTRYSNGSATLELKDAEAALSDGPTVVYSGCKAAGS